MTRWIKPVGLLLSLGLILAACASDGSALEIGFRRVALDLAFKDEALAKPLPPAQVISDVLGDDFDEPLAPIIRRIPARPDTECLKAPEGLSPERVAFAVVREEPRPGVYLRRNKGTVEIELATGQKIDVPMPPKASIEVSSVQSYVGLPLTGEEREPVGAPVSAAEPVTQLFEFSITRKPVPNQQITDFYRYSNKQEAPLEVDPQADNEANAARDTALGDYLYLVKRVTKVDGVEKTFAPTPPIRLVRLNVPEGTILSSGVVHGGIDTDTKVAMTVRSQILRRELVDVCGDVFDTYRVEIQEQFVDLNSTPPRTSGNDPGTSTFWNIQFDRGLLILREEVNTTIRTTREVAGAPLPVTVRYKYTSTNESIDPESTP